VVFVKKTSKIGEDLTIAGQLGLRVKKGHVGLEIECESKTPGAFAKMKLPQVATYWGYHQDGSLRGADNGEFVLSKPLDFTEVDAAVDALWAEFAVNKAVLAESVRTSVHVHLNVLSFYQNRLASLLALWFICEEVLSHFCGDHRAGNLFCIRAKDGPAIITEVKNWFENKGEYGMDTEGLHYSALNVSALYKFGSVEFRTMRGLTEAAPVKQWVRILKRLYDESEKYTDPRTIIERFSIQGPMEFFTELFGNEAPAILQAVQNEVNVSASLFEGMRFAQDIAYSRDWSTFNPVKVASDPFGRKTAKKTRRVVAGGYGVAVEPDLPEDGNTFAGNQWNAAEMQAMQNLQQNLNAAHAFTINTNTFAQG
jgi:hypothetical protein